jgi:hypothetical protein
MKKRYHRSSSYIPTTDELEYIQAITNETKMKNKDNITRTKAYLKFYQQNPDIIWAFLASMVSRNGGYNMCDLEGEWFPKLIEEQKRNLLFLTFERANWLIFHDAFPQMLLYYYSTKLRRPMFHLLRFLHVSAFMEAEWNYYWEHRNKKRLLVSLIINEQNVIQTPIIEHPVYKDRIFHSFLFSLQDWLHFSVVIFPTCAGELYGASVNGFRVVDKRIDLGKRLSDILFDPNLFPQFLEFAIKTEHTGSRYDYEQYFQEKRKRFTPFIRNTFPVVSHHVSQYEDWSEKRAVKRSWYYQSKHRHTIHLTNWYKQKQKQIQAFISLGELTFDEI